MINARQVEAFRAVMLSGTVTAAARLLNVSQPSVSRLLANLETAIGFKLFVPRGRTLIPTAEAGEFFKEVERHFSGLSELEVAANNIRHFSHGRLVIGNIAATTLEIMPKVVRSMRRTHPNMTYDFRVRSTFQIIDWCRSAKIDIGVISRVSEVPGVEILFERKLQYVALLPETHTLAGGSKRLSPQNLRNETLIAPSPDDLVSRTTDPEMQELLSRGTAISVEISTAAATMAQTGIGVAIVDPLTACYFCRAGGLKTMPLESPPSYDFSVITPVVSRPSGFLSSFVARVEACLQDVGGCVKS